MNISLKQDWTTTTTTYNNYCNMQIEATKHTHTSQSSIAATSIETYNYIQREPLQYGEI
jgi:hypothetical protein